MKTRNEEISFKEIANVILPKLWLIVLISLIVTALTFVYCNYLKKDTYTSSFDIYIYKGDSNTSPSVSDIQTAADMLETYEYILTTNNFLEAILLQLPKEYSSVLTADTIRAMMSISAVGNSGALRISLTSYDADFVAGLCKNFAPAIPNQIIDSIPNALKVSITEGPTRTPLAPNSKHVLRNSLIAFAVSAVLLMGAVWVFDAFDTIIRDKKKLEENFDIPVLGVIPRQEVFLKRKEGEDGAV